MAAGSGVHAADIQWDGGSDGSGTNWGDSANWVGDVSPSAGDSASFALLGTVPARTISLGASQAVHTVNFRAGSGVGGITIGSAADIADGNTLTLTNVFRGKDNANVQTFATNIRLAGNSTWNIISGYNGSVAVTGSIGSDSAATLTKDGTSTLTLNGANTFTGDLRVFSGTVSLGNSNAYAGTTTAAGGTVQLNFNAGAAPATNIINASSSLVFGGLRGGGTITASGKNLANAVNSQAFAGTTVGVGASTLTIANGTASGKTAVNLGAITRNTGGTLNFVQPTTNATVSAQNGYVTSTGNDSSGIIGAWAVVGGTEYATNDGTNVVAYTGYTDQTDNTLVNGTTTNLRITSGTIGALVQNAGTTTINTLRVNDAAARAVTVGAGNTLRVNGILSNGAGGLTLGEAANAGTLTAGSADDTAAELVIYNTTAVTVNSVVADNGTGAVALTKSGSGTTTLAGGGTYTGGTTVNAGTLAVIAGSTNPLAAGGAITVAGGTLSLGTGTSQTVTGPVTMADGTMTGGTLTNNGTAIEARNGTISTKLAGSAGINKTMAGTLTLSNTSANTFTGDTVITEGSVVGGAGANVIAINGNLIVGSESGGNAASYSNSGTNVAFNNTKNLTVYSNGSVNFGNGAQSLNGVVNVLGGTVTGTQLFKNSMVNMTGGTWAGTSRGSNSSFIFNASAGIATVSAWLERGANNSTFNVNDGAVALISGNMTGTGTMTKNGVGLLKMTGSKTYTGATVVGAGLMEVDNLAAGGVASAIGQSTNVSTNLRLGDGATLRYTGTGHSTDRLFAVSGGAAGHSATIEASGTGAVDFTNTGSTTWGTNNQTRTLKLGGTSTANNTLAALLANNGTGAVSLTKQDAGKWIITGNNTYTGATTINGGSLIVSGSIAAASAVAVNSGGTLGGSGTIGGSVTVSSGGFLAPGNSPGVLTVGSLTLNSGSTTAIEIAGAAVRGTDFDGINVTAESGLTYGGTLNLSFTGTLSEGALLDLFSFTGAAGGAFESIVSTGAYTGTWTENAGLWSFAGNDQLLTFSQATGDLAVGAIPEPSTYAMLGGMIALSLACGRRSARRRN